MVAQRPTCPECGTDLSRVVRISGVRWPCPSCGGVAVEIGALEEIELLREPAPGGSATPCPFCGRPLALTTVAGAVVGVCEMCEGAWLDAEARTRLPGGGAGRELIASGERCAACGAPWAPNPDGSCRCCYGFDGEHDPGAVSRRRVAT